MQQWKRLSRQWRKCGPNIFMVKKIIIADTNWWISLLISNFENSFASLLEDETLEFCSCDELENEIPKCFQKNKTSKISQRGNNKDFLGIIQPSRLACPPSLNGNYLSGSKRQFSILALSKDAEADFLITGDKDLLELEKFGRTIICTLNDFIQKHFQK